MNKHFKRNYDTFSEIFLDKIICGGSLSVEIDSLRSTAKKYINRANLVNNASTAINLNKAWGVVAKAAPIDHQAFDELIAQEQQLYDVVHDDLFIVAAFENYAKANLLSKRYVVHRLTKPKSLAKKQWSEPIHVNTIRSRENIDEIYFQHKTIGINDLLQPKYIERIGITEKAEYSIRKCRSIRNQIHFGGPKMVGYGTGLYEGLIELREIICS
ncbi:MAG: hypothetical protein ABW168_13965 [Sedimenticola sp.]